ncbi:MAG: VOC family protein [Leptolyngbyaceae cyanobacterium]
MRRFHIAIATQDLAATIEDYTQRLGMEPTVVVPAAYALWRTDTLNFSVRQDLACQPGNLRHLGWEDDTAEQMTADTDCNGIVWELFTAPQQAVEIDEIWPEGQPH